MTNYQAINELVRMRDTMEKFYTPSIKELDALNLGISALKTIDDIGADTLTYLTDGVKIDDVSRETLQHIYDELTSIHTEMSYGNNYDSYERILSLITYMEGVMDE